MAITLTLLRSGDEDVLARVAPDVFDEPIDPVMTSAFLRDERHHIAVAVDDDIVVGFASAVDYLHPDKPPELWINEVGVAPTHGRRGIAKALLGLLFDAGRQRGCGVAWTLTERTNIPAMRLYRSCGGTEPEDETVMFSFEL